MLAQSRLDDIIDGAVRDEISNRFMSEIVRSTDRQMVFMIQKLMEEERRGLERRCKNIDY